MARGHEVDAALRRLTAPTKDGENPEREAVVALDKQLDGALTKVASTTLMGVAGAGTVVATAAKQIELVLPWDRKRNRLPSDRVDAATDMDLLALSRFIADSDTVRVFAGSVLPMMGRDFDQKEALMAAIAGGRLLAQDGDDGFLGRFTSRPEKLNTYRLLGLPEALYTLTRVPAIRGMMDYATYMGRVWTDVFEDCQAHFAAYEDLRNMQHGLLDLASIYSQNRGDLAAQVTVGETDMKVLEPEIERLSTLISRKFRTLPDERLLEMSQELDQLRAAHNLASLESVEALLRMQRDIILEHEASAGTIQADKTAWALVEQIMAEQTLLGVCEEGVMTILQSLSRLMIAAATSVRRAQMKSITGEKYSVNRDQFFMETVGDVRQILTRYSELVANSGRQIAAPVADLKIGSTDRLIAPTRAVAPATRPTAKRRPVERRVR